VAHQAHRAAEHSKAAIARFGRTLVGPPDMAFFDSIAADF
jgi:quinol monooxygenase YgiN